MSRFVSNAGRQVADLADQAADEGRLSRGRALFRKGSVSDLSVVEGSVAASVRGSRGDGYQAAVDTALAPPGVIRQIAQAREPGDRWSLDELIGDGLDLCPREVDLVFSCDCADWEEPCKHVVAVLLALADRVDLDEAELLRWRGVDLTRSAAGERPPSSPADEAEDRSARLSELEALLGDTVMRVPAAGGSDPEPPVWNPGPALAEFLGIGLVVEPIDVGTIATPAPLFADVQLGPLADLGPALSDAVATIIATLERRSPD